MRVLAALLLAALLVGCGTKSTVQKWKGSQPAMAPYSGPVCLLPGKLPDGVEYTLLGRAVANQQSYGGFAGVKQELVSTARSVGADAVTEQQQKMKVGAWAWARPQVWGFAVRLKNPQAFDCVANGGTVYPGAYQPAQTTKPIESPGRPQTYDECMARIMKISDPKLRAASMSACDAN